jgi:hypothetical protein
MKSAFYFIINSTIQGVNLVISKWKFTYDHERDLYICPNNQKLAYRTTTREGYREYKSNLKKCENCPLLSQCTRSKNKVKVVTHMFGKNIRKK